jgi:hypothetical protein
MGEAKRRRDAEAAQNMVPIVEPKDWQPIEGAAVTVALFCGTATLRAGMPTETVEACKKVDLSEATRQTIKNDIVRGMKDGKHLNDAEGRKMLAGALALILTGEVGEIMRLMADQPGMTFTYHITPLPPPAPPNSYNWRLITAGGAPDDARQDQEGNGDHP